MSRKRNRRSVPKGAPPAEAPQKVHVNAMDVFRAQDAASKAAVTKYATLDGFDNFISRLGLNNDNALSGGTYAFNLVTRNRILLEAAYRGSWIVGNVIDTYAEDMTRAGLELTTSAKDDIDVFQKAMVRLQIWQSIRTDIKWGRLYGGAIGVLQLKGQDLSTPLNLDSVGKDQFQGIVVFDRWQLNPLLSPVIDSGPNMGLPAFYQIVNNPTQTDPSEPSATGQVTVHHSRCIRYTGIDLPYFQAITEQMWGESVLERLWDRLISFDNATLSSAQLIDRANLRTVGIENLREIIAAGGEAEAGLRAQFDMMRLLQVNEGLTLIDKNDTFASTAYSFAGLSDMMLQFGQQLAGASGIPLVRLFGQSPAGLNSTGDGDIRMYYDSIRAQQEAKLRDPFEVLIKVMWRSVFGKPAPDDLEFSFTPLWQMDAKDKADIAKTNTETVIGAYEAALVPAGAAMKELQSLSGDTGIFSNISDEDILEAELEPPPLPDAPPEVPEGTGGAPVGGEKPKEPVKNLDAKPRGFWRWFRSSDAGNFKEGDHPRKEDGKFGSGGGKSGEGEKKEKAPAKKKAGKLRASAGSKEGIEKLLGQFTGSKNISLHESGPGEYDVHNAKGKIEGYSVREHKGRWRFETHEG